MAMPINSADRIVKINAWINATSNSIRPINTAKMTDAGATAIELKIKIKQISDNTKICPAVMLANKRIASAAGLVNMPKISTGIISGLSHQGTGGLKIWAQ